MVDLPGSGRSEGKVDSALREVFLKGLITKLRLKKPFIVAPSMSGTYAIPYGISFVDFVAPVLASNCDSETQVCPRLPTEDQRTCSSWRNKDQNSQS